MKKLRIWLSFLGWPAHPQPLSEQLLASLGAMLGIFVTWKLSGFLLAGSDSPWLIASMGATAILIFAVPHSPLTQPWPVLGGHILSALVGISCQRLLPGTELALCTALGAALLLMHAARCVHPPGGATAVLTVIGGPSIHALGYSFVLMPVAVNALFLVILGMGFNASFPWRRYPASLMRHASPLPTLPAWPAITAQQVDQAIAQHKGFVDIHPDELKELIESTLRLAAAHPQTVAALRTGMMYGNQLAGPAWSVRQIIEERPSDNPEHDVIVFRIVEGDGSGRTDSCLRREFIAWAGCELHPR